MTLERKDKNQWNALISLTIKTLLALHDDNQVPVLTTILNDEHLIKTVSINSTPEFFTPESLNQIVRPYSKHLAAQSADFNRLLQRNQLIDSLQGYLDREDRKSTHKRQPVEALMADLKKGGEAAQRDVWYKNDNFYDRTFLKGELLACMTKYDLQVFFKAPFLPAYVPMTPPQVITPGAASHTGVSSMSPTVIVDNQNYGLELRVVVQLDAKLTTDR